MRMLSAIIVDDIRDLTHERRPRSPFHVPWKEALALFCAVALVSIAFAGLVHSESATGWGKEPVSSGKGPAQTPSRLLPARMARPYPSLDDAVSYVGSTDDLYGTQDEGGCDWGNWTSGIEEMLPGLMGAIMNMTQDGLNVTEILEMIEEFDRPDIDDVSIWTLYYLIKDLYSSIGIVVAKAQEQMDTVEDLRADLVERLGGPVQDIITLLGTFNSSLATAVAGRLSDAYAQLQDDQRLGDALDFIDAHLKEIFILILLLPLFLLLGPLASPTIVIMMLMALLVVTVCLYLMVPYIQGLWDAHGDDILEARDAVKDASPRDGQVLEAVEEALPVIAGACDNASQTFFVLVSENIPGLMEAFPYWDEFENLTGIDPMDGYEEMMDIIEQGGFNLDGRFFHFLAQIVWAFQKVNDFEATGYNVDYLDENLYHKALVLTFCIVFLSFPVLTTLIVVALILICLAFLLILVCMW